MSMLDRRVDNNTLPTKEKFFIFPESVNGGARGNYAGATLLDNERTALTGHFPNDFTSITEIVLVLIGTNSAGAGFTTLTLNTDWAAVNEAFNAQTDTDVAVAVVAPANQIIEEDLSAVFNAFPVTAGDFFGVEVIKNADGSDNAEVLGVRLRYT